MLEIIPQKKDLTNYPKLKRFNFATPLKPKFRGISLFFFNDTVITKNGETFLQCYVPLGTLQTLWSSQHLSTLSLLCL